MTILPIKSINETDQPLFGVNLFNLAKLSRNGFEIPPGIALSPWELVLQTVLKHLEVNDKEILDQKLVVIKNELHNIPYPKELEKDLKGHKWFYLKGQNFKKINKLWSAVLEVWLEEIRALIFKNGFQSKMLANLHPVIVYFIKKQFRSVQAYFDPDLEDVIIKCAFKPEPGVLKEIDQTVMLANKKLYLPQVYDFLTIDKKIYLAGLSPFTQSLPVSQNRDIVIPKDRQKRLIKSAVKIFLNLSSGFAIAENADGVLIEGERIEDFDTTVFKLAEAGISFHGKPVIYKLPDIYQEEVRGTLRLLHQEKLLGLSSKAFLFARNKKNLLNLELAVPFIRSADEYIALKQELLAYGVSRKGSLKFWLEAAVPENILNIEEYLACGLDGVILDLDKLQKFLGGYSVEEGEFYKRHILALIKFIKPLFNTLNKARVPILAKGELVLHPEVLDFLIEAGVFGVVANNMVEAESLPDHLNWAERRMVIKRLN